MFKLLSIIFVALCLSQVQGAPRDLAADLEADLEAAVVSTEALLASSVALIFEEEQFYNVVATDVFDVLQGVLTSLADFGVEQSLLDQLLTNMSLAHLTIQAEVDEQISHVVELLALLAAVLEDLTSNPYNLVNDSWDLAEQRSKINANFIDATIVIATEMSRIENNIADLILGLTPGQAGEVEAEMARARGLVNAQRDLVVAAERVVDAGISDLTGQLDNIVSQLPQPQKLSETRPARVGTA